MRNPGTAHSITFWLAAVLLVVGPLLLWPAPAVLADSAPEGEEDDSGEAVGEMSEAERETAALDSTATQWSFQLAYQSIPDYHDDTLDDGTTRPAGLDDYIQLRIVAPVVLNSLTILPRLTVRHYENAAGESGLGNTELFALIIPKKWDWGSGRFGIGPLVTTPGSTAVAKDEWGAGFAMGAVNAKGKWFYGLLLTQSWQAVSPETLAPGSSNTNPLGLAPFLNYRLGKGWYIGNGDMVALYDWDSGGFYLPLAIRVGKVIVNEKSSWNIYGEYSTSLIYSNWDGSAKKNAYRFNISYTIPVG